MNRFDLSLSRSSIGTLLGFDPMSVVSSAAELCLQSKKQDKKKVEKKKVEKKIKPDDGEGLFV